MSVVSAIVLLAVIWFMTLFVVIPVTIETQEEAGEEVEGTHAGAPSSRYSMRRAIRITSIWAFGLWVVIAGVVLYGGISVEDIDFFNISRRTAAG